MRISLFFFRKIFSFWVRDPLFWWLLVAAPLLGLAILVGLFGPGAMHKLPVAVCDQDGSSLSREWIRKMNALPSVQAGPFVTSPAEGLSLLKQGKVYGLIIIPDNTEYDILRNRSTQITIYIDGQHMPAGSVLKRDLAELGTSIWETYYKNILERSNIPASATQELSSTLSIDLRSAGNPSINYRLFLIHGFLPVLIQLVSLVYMVFRMKNRHQAEELGTVFRLIIPAFLWTWLICCTMVFVLRRIEAVPSQCPFLLLCGAYLCFMLCCTALALFISGLCDDQLQSLMCVSALCSPAFAFSGVTFPLSAMPFFGKFWAGLLPSTHLLNLETAINQLGASSADLLPSLAALLFLCFLYGTGGIIFFVMRKKGSASV